VAVSPKEIAEYLSLADCSPCAGAFVVGAMTRALLACQADPAEVTGLALADGPPRGIPEVRGLVNAGQPADEFVNATRLSVTPWRPTLRS
jgi:hypothetical protein